MPHERGRRRFLEAGLGLTGVLVPYSGVADATGSGIDDRSDGETPDGDTDFDRTIRTETGVVFETPVPPDIDYDDVEWVVDETAVSGKRFLDGYQDHTGNAATARVFESNGTYTVTARRPDGDVLESWRVAVTPDGAREPVIETMETSPPTGALVAADYTVDVIVSAHDPEGRLTSVLWQDGQNMITIWDETDVHGTHDIATLELTGPGGWLSAGYSTRAAVLTADGRFSDVESERGPTVRPRFDVSIADTNDPVTRGSELEVDAEIRYGDRMFGTMTDEKEIELVLGDESVDTESVELGPGEETTITLTGESVEAGAIEAAVRSPSQTDSVIVDVRDPLDVDRGLEVTVTETNDPVSISDRIEALARITTEEDEAAELTVRWSERLGTQFDTIGTESVTVSPDDRTFVRLRYDEYQPPPYPSPERSEADGAADPYSFGLHVSLSGDIPPNQPSENLEDTTVVTVDDTSATDPRLAVTIVDTNAPLDANEYLVVTVAAHNPTPEETIQDVRLLVGDASERVDERGVSVDPYETTTVRLGCELPTRTDASAFPVRVETVSAFDEFSADERLIDITGTTE